MSASVVEQILARVQVALLNTTLAAAHVFRSREDALGADEIPALIIRRTSSNEDAFANNLERIVVAFDIEHHIDVDVTDVGVWETSADALHMQTHALLLADAPLAALGRGLRCTGTDAGSDSTDRIVGRLVAHYQMQILVRPGDLTRAVL